MNSILEKTFIKNKDLDQSRDEYGNLAGWVGIVSNFILFVAKLLIGFLTSSLAIMGDAINNLSDFSASIIVVVGFKLSQIPADDEHPYGHARFEYVSGLLVSTLIVVIGAQFFINSVKKIINPTPTDFSLPIAIVLLITIGVKIWQGLFYNNIGRKINSSVLKATAIDSRNDVIITIIILIGSIIQYFFNLNLDGPLGLIVAIFIMISGIDLMRDTLTPLLGEAPKKKLVKEIYDKVNSYQSVIGTHDLMVHSYGHDRTYATIHVEMPAEQDIMESHEIIDEIERDFHHDLNINLVIHLDPVITNDPEIDRIEEQIITISKEIDPKLSIHDFRIVRYKDVTKVLFDVTVPDGYKKSNNKIRARFEKEIKKIDSKYESSITIDRNYVSSYE